MSKKVYVASIGDPNDMATFGGTPYYFLQEGIRQGFIDKGISLKANTITIKLARIAWTFRSFVLKLKYGGFQYSDLFLDAVWQGGGKIERASIINFFQLYPNSIVVNDNIEKWFYIDQTLGQMFSTYGKPGNLGQKDINKIILREKKGYVAAKGIFVVSESAKRDLCISYGIDERKICVVPRGANIDCEHYSEWSLTSAPSSCFSDNPLRFVFVGRDAYRKGLDRMLAAFGIAEGKGANIELLVVGTDELKSTCASKRVRWVGHIDKKRDLNKYLEILSSSDVGCLLSRAEAGGISLREFHATGLPVIFPEVGGSECFVMPDASFPVKPSSSASEVADLLMYLDKNRELVAHKKNIAWSKKEEMLWAHAVGLIKEAVLR